jgi:hypothetical protein
MLKGNLVNDTGEPVLGNSIMYKVKVKFSLCLTN